MNLPTKEVKSFFKALKGASSDTFIWNGKKIPVKPELPKNLKKKANHEK